MRTEVDGILVAAKELKRPLSELRQLALAFDGAGASDEEIRREMVEVSERAMRQVNDLMRMRRLEKFSMEPVAVRGVCEEVRREFKGAFRGAFRYANRAPLVTANRELLKSVVYNLMLNAVNCETEDKAELLVREVKGRVEVSVRDFGPALPTEVWKRLMDGELEAPTSIAMRPLLSGLSIYIATRFSEYMNAEVGAVRHRDGTSFYVRLPVSRQGVLF